LSRKDNATDHIEGLDNLMAFANEMERESDVSMDDSLNRGIMEDIRTSVLVNAVNVKHDN